MDTKDTETTVVVFRADRSGPFKDDVTAVFPEEPGDYSGRTMLCYAHIGQHGACSRDWYDRTRPATPLEYIDLESELECIGYRLKVRKRITYAMDTRRREAVRA